MQKEKKVHKQKPIERISQDMSGPSLPFDSTFQISQISGPSRVPTEGGYSVFDITTGLKK